MVMIQDDAVSYKEGHGGGKQRHHTREIELSTDGFSKNEVIEADFNT